MDTQIITFYFGLSLGGALLVASIVQVLKSVQVANGLREANREEWVRLGKPTFLRMLNWGVQLKFLKYYLSKEYRQINDEKIENAVKHYATTQLVQYAVLLIISFVAALG